MTGTRTLKRTRPDLAEFLRVRRTAIAPESVGLPAGGRRRTPGLRREEVATLAGVGVTWYTWLEQGRDIGVSAAFLDRLADVLSLDAAARRHLYLLAQQRPPAETGRAQCRMPALIHRLLQDLSGRPAYVLNLRWDVLAWNTAADGVFQFSRQPSGRRNLLWMLFTSDDIRKLLVDWEIQARRMLSSFRRDFAQGINDPDIAALVQELNQVAPEFAVWWGQHDIHAPCRGVRTFRIEPVGAVDFEHTTLTIDAEDHLRLVYYAAIDDEDASHDFHEWIAAQA